MEKSRVRWWHSLLSCRSPATDGEGSSSARAEFGPDCRVTRLDPLRHPVALSRTAVTRGMIIPVWMVLDVSLRFVTVRMRSGLNRHEHRGIVRCWAGSFASASSSLAESSSKRPPRSTPCPVHESPGSLGPLSWSFRYTPTSLSITMRDSSSIRPSTAVTQMRRPLSRQFLSPDGWR